MEYSWQFDPLFPDKPVELTCDGTVIATTSLNNAKELAHKLNAYTDLYEALMEPSNELLEIGRKAIEDVLVDWRDNRLSEFLRGNGLVIREKDGSDSSIIRFGPETALRIGMKAMGQAIAKAERS